MPGAIDPRCVRCVLVRLTSTNRWYQTALMRTTSNLDRDVYEAAMHLSRASGRRLGKVLCELARRGLVRGAPEPSKGKRRFPVFDIPPNAPIIPASRVQEVVDEEGFF